MTAPGADWHTRPPRPSNVDPAQLVAALSAAGWRPDGGRPGAYTRLWWPGECPPRGRTMYVPLDRAFADFDDEMGDVLRDLIDAADQGSRAAAVLDVLAGADPPAQDEPSDLDAAMFSIHLHGRWRELTTRMTTEEREAAVAAILRYDRWSKRDEPNEPPMTRERLAWWD